MFVGMRIIILPVSENTEPLEDVPPPSEGDLLTVELALRSSPHGTSLDEAFDAALDAALDGPLDKPPTPTPLEYAYMHACSHLWLGWCMCACFHSGH